MLEAFTVSELSDQCREQTARYLRNEPSLDRFCMELFRRAIMDRDERAWSAIYGQYASIARRWLGTKMDPEEGVAAAFERFWRALDREKFHRFGSLAAVLAYLKMCVHTTAIDHARSQRSAVELHSLEIAGEVASKEDVEGAVAERVDRATFWQQISTALKDERACRALYLSYAIGLSPREICSRHPMEFPDVGMVYQLKRNALDRLRRSRLILS
jgi:DNA-directed RNA polymerase specialized sigma24 family protein